MGLKYAMIIFLKVKNSSCYFLCGFERLTSATHTLVLPCWTRCLSGECAVVLRVNTESFWKSSSETASPSVSSDWRIRERNDSHIVRSLLIYIAA